MAVEGLRKRFGGVRAVDDVSFAVNEGDLHGVIGPNGSGKTTVFNVISGVYKPDAGEVRFNGQQIGGAPPHAITRRGIARTFQNLRLFKSMSVLENVLVGLGGYRRGGGTMPTDPFLRPRLARKEERAMREHGRALLRRVGLDAYADAPATALPYGKQRKVEIVRALAVSPRLLLLDEPAAGLNADETRELDDFLQSLVTDGLTILMIEHDMRLVMGICSTVTVLHRGTVIAHGTPAVVRADAGVVAAYLGDRAD
jgi:branched-chain amino acid transport system ATP-binding protein